MIDLSRADTPFATPISGYCPKCRKGQSDDPNAYFGHGWLCMCCGYWRSLPKPEEKKPDCQ